MTQHRTRNYKKTNRNSYKNNGIIVMLTKTFIDLSICIRKEETFNKEMIYFLP